MAIRVLLVDDSAVVRKLLRAIFAKDDAFEVMGEAANGVEAVAQVRRERPGLIVMDLEMPLMGGVGAIEEIMSFCPVPILVVTDFANAQRAYAAVAHGALEVVAKSALTEQQVDAFLARARLVASIPVITHVKSLRHYSPTAKLAMAPLAAGLPDNRPVFGVTSSTGGPQALCRVLSQLPDDFNCPILIAQHVIPGFAAGMAKWLASESSLPVKLAEQGETLVAGQVYLSPSEAHLSVVSGDRIDLLALREGDTYRPSCDVLLESMAAVFGRRSVGIILTGMGADGARGLARVKAAGGTTWAQDEASSVVYGMNRVAVESGAVKRVLALGDIAAAMVQLACANS
jgi:two-component system, chemotaxis family, protein-glutamate methylesterase/glutaminase